MNRILLVIMSVTLLMFAGCIDYREEITINEDGSGTIKLHYAIEREYMDQFDAVSEMDGEEGSSDEGDIPSEEEIKEMISTGNANVELISYSYQESEEWETWEMEFSFESIAGFADLGIALSEDEDPVGPEVSYTKQDDGSFLFQRYFGGESLGEMPADESGEDVDLPDSADYYEAMAAMTEAMQQMSEEQQMEGMDDDSMQQMMAEYAQGMSDMTEGINRAMIRLEVHFPGEVVESNATSTEGNTAIWEYSGEKMVYGMPPVLEARIK